MTSKSDFPDDEWARVIRAPLVAGMAIMLADPGGPIEATKETMASIRTATNPPTREQLVTEVALDVQAEVQAKRNPLKGFKPDGTSSPGDQVLAELTAVQDIVAARATERRGCGIRSLARRCSTGGGRRGEGRRVHGHRRPAGQRT